MDIKVTSPNAVYITMKDYTIYVDYSMPKELIIDKWHKDDVTCYETR